MKKHSFSQKVLNFLNGKGFYIALGLCVAVIGVSGYFLWQDVTTAAELASQTSRTQTVVVEPDTQPDTETLLPKKAEEPEKPEEKAPADKKVTADKKDSKPTADTDPADESGEQEDEDPEAEETIAEPKEPVTETVQPEQVKVPEETAAQADAGWLWPLEGDVVAAFSADTLTYNAAMGDWRTHSGLDLSASLGQQVTAACAGTVISIQEDALLGETVVVDCGGGLTVSYSNLAQEVSVQAGQKLSAGDAIGTVGDTAVGEVSETPWLHFAVARNGQPVDPREFLG